LPEVQTYSGTGDSIVDVEVDVGAALVHIAGNESARHFAVKNYGPGNEPIDLLVNTTDPYEGYVPLDFLDAEQTTRFEVTATGHWAIEIIPIAPIPEMAEHFLEVPGTYEGNGDNVIFLTGETPDLAAISGNQSAHHFAVIAYDEGGRDLHVNTTDPYEGRVMLKATTIALVVKAVGPWTIEVTSAN
jgi:hypothetical protein